MHEECADQPGHHLLSRHYLDYLLLTNHFFESIEDYEELAQEAKEALHKQVLVPDWVLLLVEFQVRV